MTTQEIALAFVSSPRWQWRAGLRAVTRDGKHLRILGVNKHFDELVYVHDDGLVGGDPEANCLTRACDLGSVPSMGWLPDLNDAGTIGTIASIVEPNLPDEFLTELLAEFVKAD